MMAGIFGKQRRAFRQVRKERTIRESRERLIRRRKESRKLRILKSEKKAPNSIYRIVAKTGKISHYQAKSRRLAKQKYGKDEYYDKTFLPGFYVESDGEPYIKNIKEVQKIKTKHTSHALK